jgi:hypothetical protein
MLLVHLGGVQEEQSNSDVASQQTKEKTEVMAHEFPSYACGPRACVLIVFETEAVVYGPRGDVALLPLVEQTLASNKEYWH